MKCFCQISKIGDIISILPILKKEFDETGVKPNLVIAKQYADLLDGVTYVEPVIYDGHWSDLAGAIKFAKSKFNEVITIQTHGKDFPIQQKMPGYQIDQYLRAGRLDDWELIPLVFDNRNKKREYALRDSVVGRKSGPFILIADASQSSPFPQIDEMISLIESEFGSRYKIIKLSAVKSEKFYDLLGLYDKASALVSIDTAHLHLAKASKVPIFALSADRWRGSSCSRRFDFHMRYSEWGYRKNKLISEMKATLNNESRPEIHELPTEFKHGYNLSIGESGYSIYRYHEGSWKTKLAIVVDGKTHNLKTDDAIREHSVEDLRQFSLNGRHYGTYTVAALMMDKMSCYCAYGEITEKDGTWSIGHIQIKYTGNDFTGLTKNLCPFVVDGKLFMIYGIKGDEQIILQVENDKVLAEYKSPAPKWSNGEIRGGTVIVRPDSLLRFFHSRADYKTGFRYFIGASVMDNKPPFQTSKICKTSILSGNELFTPNAPRWKQNVTFPLGAIQDGDNVKLSAGFNDCRSAIVTLKPEHLKL